MICDQNMTLDILTVTWTGWADGRGRYESSPNSLSLKLNVLMLVISQIGLASFL